MPAMIVEELVSCGEPLTEQELLAEVDVRGYVTRTGKRVKAYTRGVGRGVRRVAKNPNVRVAAAGYVGATGALGAAAMGVASMHHGNQGAKLARDIAAGAALGPLAPPAAALHNSKVHRAAMKASRARAAASRRAARNRIVTGKSTAEDEIRRAGYRSQHGGLFGVDPFSAADALRRSRSGRPRRPDMN